jgi:hypothetical protein
MRAGINGDVLMSSSSLFTGTVGGPTDNLDSEHDDKPGRPPGRPTVEVYNVQYPPRSRSSSDEPATGDVAGGWLLTGASVLLLALAAAQGYVSFRAQYQFVHTIKHEHLASMLEALGLDAAAVIFALLALAQARLGRPGLTERVLNVACVAGSLAMNAMSAKFDDPKSVAAWTLPALLYAAASDRLVAVVRRRALSNRPEADEEGSAYAAVAGTAMWFLRLLLAPFSTLRGFRAWVVETAPVAPGRRIGPNMPTFPHAEMTTVPATAERDVTAPEHAPPLPSGTNGLAALNGHALNGHPVTEQPVLAAAPRGGDLAALDDLMGLLQGQAANGGMARGTAERFLELFDQLGETTAPEPMREFAQGIRAFVDGEQPAEDKEAGGGPEPSKREMLIRRYDELGATGDPRYMTRAEVGPLARELAPLVGYAHPATARNVLHRELDQRGVPREDSDVGGGA